MERRAADHGRSRHWTAALVARAGGGGWLCGAGGPVDRAVVPGGRHGHALVCECLRGVLPAAVGPPGLVGDAGCTDRWTALRQWPGRGGPARGRAVCRTQSGRDGAWWLAADPQPGLAPDPPQPAGGLACLVAGRAAAGAVRCDAGRAAAGGHRGDSAVRHAALADLVRGQPDRYHGTAAAGAVAARAPGRRRGRAVAGRASGDRGDGGPDGTVRRYRGAGPAASAVPVCLPGAADAGGGHAPALSGRRAAGLAGLADRRGHHCPRWSDAAPGPWRLADPAAARAPARRAAAAAAAGRGDGVGPRTPARAGT